MKKNPELADELRPEYDMKQLLKGAIRGKYAKRYAEGTNLVLLAPVVGADPCVCPPNYPSRPDNN